MKKIEVSRDKCPACEGKGFEFVKKKEFIYLRCQKCRLVYVKNCLKKTGYDYRKESFGNETLLWKYLTEPKRRHYQLKRLLDLKYKNKKKSVDISEIGTGAGALASLFIKDSLYNYNGYEGGIGLSSYYKSKGMDIKEGYFEKEKIESKFDVVILDNVLEHTLNPKNLLEACFRSLKSEGICLVIAPNFNDIRKYKKSWRDKYFWTPGEHINCFTYGNLKKLILRVGFFKTSNFPLRFIFKNPFHLLRVLADRYGIHIFGLYIIGYKK